MHERKIMLRTALIVAVIACHGFRYKQARRPERISNWLSMTRTHCASAVPVCAIPRRPRRPPLGLSFRRRVWSITNLNSLGPRLIFGGVFTVAGG